MKGYVERLLEKSGMHYEEKNDAFRVFDLVEGVVVGSATTAVTPKIVSTSLEKIAIAIGKSSTGKAISSLTGIAQKNAAQVFFGGGAKAVGGAGIKDGKTLTKSLSGAS